MTAHTPYPDGNPTQIEQLEEHESAHFYTKDLLKDARELQQENKELLKACRVIIAWFESEKRGPDYGSLDRDTHPHGEVIWKRWWDSQLDLCEQTERAARAALAKAKLP